MAVYAPQADYDTIKKQNPSANVTLYTGQKLSSGDVALGGSGSGISDSALNGAQRIYGADRNATASAYNSYNSKNTYVENAAGYAQKVAEAQQQQQQAAIQQALNNTIAYYNSQKAEMLPKYTTQSNTVDVNAANTARKIKEIMAAQGMYRSGGSVSDQAANLTSADQAKNDIQTNKNTFIQDIGNKISTAQRNAQSQTSASLQALADQIAAAKYKAENDWLNYEQGQKEWENTLAQQAYQQQQDKLTRDLQVAQLMGLYNGSPTLAKTEADRNYSLQAQQLAASLARGSSGGSSGTSLTAQKYYDSVNSQQATADAMQRLQGMANQKKTRSEILAFINSNAGDLQANGVDIQTLYNWATKNFSWDKDQSGEWYNTSQ